MELGYIIPYYTLFRSILLKRALWGDHIPFSSELDSEKFPPFFALSQRSLALIHCLCNEGRTVRLAPTWKPKERAAQLRGVLRWAEEPLPALPHK